jgi:antitoxin (DNA-binding transcriptional repressor) of toxin-antitoxin stability system
MKTVGLFEAKTRLSELCREVAESGEPILIERRGIPIAELVPPRRPQSENTYAALGIADALAAYNETHGPPEEDFPEVWLHRSPPKPDPLED